MAKTAGAAYSLDGMSQAGMECMPATSTTTATSNLFTTNFSDEYNTLYRNDGRGRFGDATAETGLGETALPFLGWGTGFVDFDNDGWLDLFVANGHLYPELDRSFLGLFYAQRNLPLPQPARPLRRGRRRRRRRLEPRESEPGGGRRGLRQRRRRRPFHHEPQRLADPAAQRQRRRQRLARSAADGNGEQPRRHRGPGMGAWRAAWSRCARCSGVTASRRSTTRACSRAGPRPAGRGGGDPLAVAQAAAYRRSSLRRYLEVGEP